MSVAVANQEGSRTHEAKMLFCGHCNNLLYPESNEERRMLYRCACCRRIEDHDDNITVYVVNGGGGGQSTRPEEQRLLAEFASDPTAQRDPNKKCVNCARTDVACFVNPLAQPTEDMTLYFACADCKHVWKNEVAETKRR
ncbi:DNA-directed RNA polymerase II, putative [Bodo saltans]|uniref:DNA-directed RNA polymerase II, putative n=1 Tax=Bodo saltans TaxID=75058 RepID=A0A0S4IUR8_BODSA|nr:DNA-directed RNA polymerase II, putative [Bodo saltans]|eukprot:CUF99983.1 DNA-directed RNA polymerase II, putative [Bodo saltans]